MNRGVPPLAERQQPGLSATLTGPKHPERCQCCGTDGAQRGLRRWIECDEWDQQTTTVVILCHGCSSRMIDPHPRLYVELEANAPFPGAMALCVHCTRRDGVTCRSPLAKQNGGPGMSITHATPDVYHWCGHGANGRRTGGFRAIYKSAPSACAGRVVAEVTP